MLRQAPLPCVFFFVVFVGCVGKVILNGVKFFSGHGELFLESLRQVVEILSQSPDYKGDRTGRYVSAVISYALILPTRSWLIVRTSS